MKNPQYIFAILICLVLLFFVSLGIYSSKHYDDERIQNSYNSFVSDTKTDLMLLNLKGFNRFQHQIELFETYNKRKVNWNIKSNQDSLFFEVRKLERMLSQLQTLSQSDYKGKEEYLYDEKTISYALDRCRIFLLNKPAVTYDLSPMPEPSPIPSIKSSPTQMYTCPNCQGRGKFVKKIHHDRPKMNERTITYSNSGWDERKVIECSWCKGLGKIDHR